MVSTRAVKPPAWLRLAGMEEHIYSHKQHNITDRELEEGCGNEISSPAPSDAPPMRPRLLEHHQLETEAWDVTLSF